MQGCAALFSKLMAAKNILFTLKLLPLHIIPIWYTILSLQKSVSHEALKNRQNNRR